MKASDYIADELHRQGVTVVFEMIGGMITHIIDSLHQKGQIRIVSVHHEQAAGFAAEAYGRVSGVPGVALATSGPGATNLVTAVGSCFFDSVPTVFITGQVNTTELSEGRSIRQQGFQETDIVSIVKPITKAAWQLKEASELPDILDKAFKLALDGRPGPVLVDIPMDLQRSEIEKPSGGFSNIEKAKSDDTSEFAMRVVEAFRTSDKPLILAGGGIRSAGITDLFRMMAEEARVPVVLSLMGLDLLPFDDPKRVGMIGTYGNRWANKAFMESDCLLALGSRLDVRQTGADTEGFKGSREIFHVDCDPGQLNNRVVGCNTCIAELADFLPALRSAFSITDSRRWDDWIQWIDTQRELYPDTEELSDCKGINPNEFMHLLSRASANAAVILADVGKNQMWAAQSVELNSQQRFLVSGGMGSMGFALPASIGSFFASGKPAVCVMGDGGIQCNIQELETIISHRIPIKMVVFNNNSLGMVGQFQEEYFESRMRSTVWGYSAPDFEAVTKAYGIDAMTISTPSQIEAAIDWLWQTPEAPTLLNVLIDLDTKVFPKAAYGRLINDMDPRRD